jgi:hypothetical protein
MCKAKPSAALSIYFYQVRQGRTWSRNYKSPSPPCSSSSDRFRIVSLWNFVSTNTNLSIFFINLPNLLTLQIEQFTNVQI